MSGPERLDVGRPSRGRGVRVLGAALAVAVLVGLVLVRQADPFDRRPVLAPTPYPAPTAAAADGRWPRTGLSGTVYVLSDDALSTLDVGSGLVSPTDVAVEPGQTALTPYAGGVLAWDATGGHAPRLLFDGQLEIEVPDALHEETTFLPGPDDGVWGARSDLFEGTAPTRWSLYDPEGHVRGSARVTGDALPDGGGGLFGAGGTDLDHVWPRQGRRQPGARLVATGQDGWVVRRCSGGGCRAELNVRATGKEVPLALVPTAEPDVGALSPGDRDVAYEAPGDQPKVHVVPLDRSGPLRFFPSGSRGFAVSWLSDRWLLAASGADLVLYDTRDQVLLHPALGVQDVTQLVWQPA